MAGCGRLPRDDQHQADGTPCAMAHTAYLRRGRAPASPRRATGGGGRHRPRRVGVGVLYRRRGKPRRPAVRAQVSDPAGAVRDRPAVRQAARQRAEAPRARAEAPRARAAWSEPAASPPCLLRAGRAVRSGRSLQGRRRPPAGPQPLASSRRSCLARARLVQARAAPAPPTGIVRPSRSASQPRPTR
jgi:hypothetical protein